MRSQLALLACCLPFTGIASGNDDTFPMISERVQSWIDQGFYPGCSVWIAQGDKVLYEKSFGNHTAETVVYIASAGKWLGAATILAVVDDGRLSLDDTVDKWLPEFQGDPKGKATLRQLLSHTSGYPPYQPEDRPRDGYQTCADSVSHLLPLPLASAPGRQFEYGGLAMQVAGRMAEVSTGKDWSAIFQEKIAQPLGMTKTRFQPVDPSHTPMIAGGAVSTMHDYSRFLAMVADGGTFEGRQVLSLRSITEMEADQVRGAKVRREEFVERRRGNTHNGIYGLGSWREEIDSGGQAMLISSPSWAGTYPWIDKRNDIRGMIIAHVGDSAGTFSGFWTSPVLMNLVRVELDERGPMDLPGYTAGTVRVADANLAYEAAGSGEPVILLHGHSFDRRMWNPQFRELSKKYRVIRYDLRGYGLSDMPVEGRDFSHADDLARLMDALEIPRAHVVGLSLGGYIVGDFLALHPERILTATIASGGVFTGQASRKPDADELTRRLDEIEKNRSEGTDSLKSKWRESLLRTPQEKSIRPLISTMIADWSAWQPLHVEPHALLGPDAIALMKATPPQVPVLWIAGARDSYQSSCQQFAEVLPKMQLVVLKNAGHLSNLENPQDFTKVLEDFLARHSPATTAGH